MEKQIIVQRGTKTVYREGDEIIKAFVPDYMKAAVLKEAFNHALAEEAFSPESGIRVPELLGVRKAEGGWALAIRAVEGRTMAQAMAEEPEKLEAYMEQLVDIQSRIHSTSSRLMGRLKDKLNAQISSLRDELDATTRYELHVRLENMKPHAKITHGDFNPTNIILGEDGAVYVIDWAHAAIGNASADAAMTYLQFALEDQAKAELYLRLFCKKNDIAIQYVQKWLPIVAAAQMTKKHGAEKEFLTRWTQVVEFE